MLHCTRYKTGGSWPNLRAKLAKGDFAAIVPKWRSMSIGGHAFRMEPESDPGACGPIVQDRVEGPVPSAAKPDPVR
jgi:hypothetical protein